ncbi:M12 family metallopeptidase [Phaeobacter sp. 22II1-1F12B]|uniref:M12 family metallopeptidase n=1 Tax=Phaeobacter sp. 22II1-1F12B TaxID=1317111 RepID=UPI000B5237DC|nr:M12 family metallopeptidase [Phaeobacter sp. 22II1-1F12B]
MSDIDTKKIEVLEREVAVKERELEHTIAQSQISAWRSPIVVAVLAAALGAFSNAGIAYLNGTLERAAAAEDHLRETQLAQSDAENDRILEMIKIGDPSQVEDNLSFLIETELVKDATLVASITAYYADRAPGSGPGASTTSVSINRGGLFRVGETVYYTFLGEFTKRQANAVDLAVNEWQKHANVIFEFTDDYSKADLRISFDDTKGNWAYLGKSALRVAPDQPTANLADVSRADSVLHVFGHILGLPNEMSNPREGIEWDEGKVIAYYAENLGSGPIDFVWLT